MKSIKTLVTYLVFMASFTSALAQESNLPKYPKNFGLRTVEKGPRPGSRAPDENATAVFERAYAYPANIRMVVRAKCDKDLKRKELIERAKNSTLATGQLAEVDWDPIRDEKFVYWAVVYTKKHVVTLNLEAKDGKYKVAKKTKKDFEYWEVVKVENPKTKKTCVDEKSFPKKNLSTALRNILNDITLKNYRSQLSPHS